jgi:predicted nucleic acid-binding protein
MTQRYGIDTSVLVRLITNLPEPESRRCQTELARMVEQEGAELFASNQVIGEAYVSVQHHYRVSKADARTALTGTLTSGLVAPLNGQGALNALQDSRGPGVLDRLIADDYSRTVSETLTLDRRMAGLPRVRRL